jgi:hypothetical protein
VATTEIFEQQAVGSVAIVAEVLILQILFKMFGPERRTNSGNNGSSISTKRMEQTTSSTKISVATCGEALRLLGSLATQLQQ